MARQPIRIAMAKTKMQDARNMAHLVKSAEMARRVTPQARLRA
jgi:hypothetical protein